MAKGSSGQQLLAAMFQSKGQLALQRAKMGMAMPSQHDFTAEAFSKAGEGIDNTNTKGAMLKGLMDGLAIGQKSKAAAEKEAKLVQQESILNEMQGNLDKIIAAEQKAVNEQQTREALLPAVMGYIQAAPTLGADGRRGNMQQLINAYNTRTGSKFELVSLDAQNPTLVTIKDGETGEVQAIDIPAMFYPDNPEINKMMGSLYPTYQREQERKDQQLAMQQAHLGIAQSHEAREQQKFNMEQMGDPAEKKYQEVAASEQAKKNIEYVEQRMEAAEKAVPMLKTVQSLKGMVKGGKVIMGQGIVSSIMRDHPKIGNALSRKGVTETQKLEAATRELIGQVNNSGIPIRNQKEFEEIVLKRLPDASKNPEAALDILNRIEGELKHNITEGHKVGTDVSRNQGHIPRDIRSRGTQRVEVITPDGRRALIPASQVEEARRKGFRVNAGS